MTRQTAHWHSCRWTAELFYYTITFTCSAEVSVRMECVSLAKQNVYLVVHKVQTKHERRFVMFEVLTLQKVIGQTMILSHSSRALRFVCCHLCKGATIAGVMWHPRSWTLCSTVLNWTFPKGSWKMVPARQSCWFCSMLFSLTWKWIWLVIELALWQHPGKPLCPQPQLAAAASSWSISLSFFSLPSHAVISSSELTVYEIQG